MDTLLTPLRTFKDQFGFAPVVINTEVLGDYTSIVVCGMGGSALSAGLLKLLFPGLPLTLHNTYGLPTSYDKDHTLFILNSYSGDTEEVLDTFERAKKEGLNLVAISRGGELLSRIQQVGGAYVELPETTLQPRFALGHQLLAILAVLGEKEKATTLTSRAALLDIAKAEEAGKDLAARYAHTYPVIYATPNLYPIAYLIKAAINEGAKIPSFVSLIPEANHNELQSFVTDDIINEKERFSFLLLSSTIDHLRTLKRFSVMESLYKEKGFVVFTHSVNHTDIFSVLESILVGYFMATHMATAKDIDPYTTPLIAEFKKRMAKQ